MVAQAVVDFKFPDGDGGEDGDDGDFKLKIISYQYQRHD